MFNPETQAVMSPESKVDRHQELQLWSTIYERIFGLTLAERLEFIRGLLVDVTNDLESAAKVRGSGELKNLADALFEMSERMTEFLDVDADNNDILRDLPYKLPGEYQTKERLQLHEQERSAVA